MNTLLNGLSPPEGHRLLADELFLPILCLVEYSRLENYKSCNASIRLHIYIYGIYNRKKKKLTNFSK